MGRKGEDETMEGGEEEEVAQGRVLQRGGGRCWEERNGAKEVGKLWRTSWRTVWCGGGGDEGEGMRGGGGERRGGGRRTRGGGRRK